MKKIFALAAVAVLTAGVSAYAANPFSDVSEDDWAYQAVSGLSVQGIVDGYPDGTFKGERNMTRYELAQIVARMLAKEDQLNAEQKAILDKLAAEFADELSNLGVRVSDLERKVGNISWSGDARLMYRNNVGKNVAGVWNGRMRINVKGQVNDSTYVYGRLQTIMNFQNAGGSDGSTNMCRLFVNHSFGKDTSVTLGRQTLTVFNGLQYDSAMDGARVDYANGKLAAYAGFGKLRRSSISGADGVALKKEDAVFAGFGYDFDVAKFKAIYFGFTGENAKSKLSFSKILGVNLVVPIRKASIFAEYWDSNSKGKDSAYQVGLGYSTGDITKPGSFDLNLAYNKIGHDTYLGATAYTASAFFNYIEKGKDLKFWNIYGDLIFMKNVYLRGEYAFNIDGDEKSYRDAYSLSLNYKF